jgi:hypothetical protein
LLVLVMSSEDGNTSLPNFASDKPELMVLSQEVKSRRKFTNHEEEAMLAHIVKHSGHPGSSAYWGYALEQGFVSARTPDALKAHYRLMKEQNRLKPASLNAFDTCIRASAGVHSPQIEISANVSQLVTVCSSGFSESDTSVISHEVAALGGNFVRDLTTDVNVLICCNPNTTKYKVAKSVRCNTVTIQWLVESKQKSFFVENYYNFNVKVLTGTQIYVSGFLPYCKKQAENLGATVIQTPAEAHIIVVARGQCEYLPNLPSCLIVFNDWLDECERANLRVSTTKFELSRVSSDQDLYLSNCIVYIKTDDECKLNELRNLITTGGGTWAKTNMHCVTHVVAERRFETHAILVHEGWLIECVKRKHIANEADFELIE